MNKNESNLENKAKREACRLILNQSLASVILAIGLWVGCLSYATHHHIKSEYGSLRNFCRSIGEDIQKIEKVPGSALYP